MGTLRRLFSRHAGRLVGALDTDFIALDDEEDGITYILKLSREDMQHALALSRRPRGSARLPSICGNVVMAGDFACIRFQGPAGTGSLVVDSALLRSRLVAALRLTHPGAVPAARVLPFPSRV